MYLKLKQYINQQSILSEDTLKLLKLALPIIGSSMLLMAYNVTDMIWVGRLGSKAVAAVGTAGFFINLGWALTSIITVGVNVKTSHAVGAKDKTEAGRFATSGAWGIGFLALIFTSVLLIWPNKLIGFFHLQDQAVNDMAISYLVISAFGIILTFITLLFLNIFNAHGKTKVSFQASLAGTIINIVLDPILIFVLGYGVQGAAFATIIARFIAMIYFLYSLKKTDEISFTGFFPQIGKLKTLLKVGVPTALQRISFTLIYIILARIIAEWGATAIAVQKIGIQIEAVSFMFCGGIIQAISILVGQCYGAKNMAAISRIYRGGLRISLGVGMVSTLLFTGIPGVLFSIFVREPESIAMGSSYLIILGVSQIFMCVEMATAGALNGLGKTHIPATVSIIFTSLRIPGAYLLGFYTFLSLNGVWWSISGSSILKGVILYLLFRRILKEIENKANN